MKWFVALAVAAAASLLLPVVLRSTTPVERDGRDMPSLAVLHETASV
jgi:hypothetical protein